MEPNVFDKVHEVDLKKTMEQSYIDYGIKKKKRRYYKSGIGRGCK